MTPSSAAKPARVHLRPGRDFTARARHPWIFSGGIARIEGDPADGDEVLVFDASGEAMGRGLWNRRSQIHVRLYTLNPAEALDQGFWEGRLESALRLRDRFRGREPKGESGPLRLVFSEADGLSGLVVDQFGDVLVVQVTALGIHGRLPWILNHLESRYQPKAILLRTEKGILEEEGLEITDGVLRGEAPEGPVEVHDGALRFRADLRTGQKTGFYLDQRNNRRAVARWAEGRRTADLCCYSGGFALHMAHAGAQSVVGVDVSASALELAAENAALNGLEDRISWEKSDALAWMRRAREGGERFDLVVLDPPRFARTQRGVPAALEGYLRLNEAALGLLEPGGMLATFSCSGRVVQTAFREVLARAATQTGRRLRILESLGQPEDHPVDPNTPESAYLKGFILAVD
jgi:23S rRNA (cytosine1962-C5)-methyltransferase